MEHLAPNDIQWLYMMLNDNELPIFFLTLSDGLEHLAPHLLISFVLELFAPNAITNIKKGKYEMTMFGEYKWHKPQLSFSLNEDFSRVLAKTHGQFK